MIYLNITRSWFGLGVIFKLHQLSQLQETSRNIKKPGTGWLGCSVKSLNFGDPFGSSQNVQWRWIMTGVSGNFCYSLLLKPWPSRNMSIYSGWIPIDSMVKWWIFPFNGNSLQFRMLKWPLIMWLFTRGYHVWSFQWIEFIDVNPNTSTQCLSLRVVIWVITSW